MKSLALMGPFFLLWVSVIAFPSPSSPHSRTPHDPEEPCSRGLKACSKDAKSLLICNADRKFEVLQKCSGCCHYSQHGYADCYIESECRKDEASNVKREEVFETAVNPELDSGVVPSGPRKCYETGAEQCGPYGRSVEVCTSRGFWAIKQKCALPNCCGPSEDDGHLECLCQATSDTLPRRQEPPKKPCKPFEVRCRGRQIIEKCSAFGDWHAEWQCTSRCFTFPGTTVIGCKPKGPPAAGRNLEEHEPVSQLST